MTDAEKAKKHIKDNYVVFEDIMQVEHQLDSLREKDYLAGLAKGRKEGFDLGKESKIGLFKFQVEQKVLKLEKEMSVLLSCSNCSENKGGYICEKEYNDKCLAQKIEYIKELKEENARLAEGKPKWHDLRKNPNDLPKEGIEVLVLYSNTYDDNGLVLSKYALRYELVEYINDEEDLTEWYWVETGTDDMVHEVIVWCELPKFEEE